MNQVIDFMNQYGKNINVDIQYGRLYGEGTLSGYDIVTKLDDDIIPFIIESIDYGNGVGDDMFIEYYIEMEVYRNNKDKFDIVYSRYLQYLYGVITHAVEITFKYGYIFRLKCGVFHSYEKRAFENDRGGGDYYINGECMHQDKWNEARKPYVLKKMRLNKIKELLNG